MAKLCNKCKLNKSNNAEYGMYAKCEFYGKGKVKDKCDKFADKNKVVDSVKVVKRYDALGWCD